MCKSVEMLLVARCCLFFVVPFGLGFIFFASDLAPFGLGCRFRAQSWMSWGSEVFFGVHPQGPCAQVVYALAS